MNDHSMIAVESWVLFGEEMRRPLLVHPKLGESSTVVVVGGGLSGMCCAYRIAEKRPDVQVIIQEQGDRLGGVISTWKEGEWTCDIAVNATRPHPAFWRLTEDLNLSSVFKPSHPKAKARWVLLAGISHRLSPSTLFKIGAIKLIRALLKSRKGGQSVADVIPHREIADALCLGIVNDTADNVDADFLLPSVTKFGPNPPIRRSIINRKIAASYPLFKPEKGSVASFDGGMQTLINALSEKLESLGNVAIKLNTKALNLDAVVSAYDVPKSAVIWTAPNKTFDFKDSEISVFAIGYHKDQVAHVEFGYGTLIPDQDLPISGVLHESDLHQSHRCPKDHRLFRLMVPHSRWDGKDDSILSCAEHLLASNPAIFTKIGERRIPRYLPGYMNKVAQIKPECTSVGWSVSGVSITHVVTESERLAQLF